MPKGPQRQIPGQLQMFMTPREIKEQYSTHIGDRKGKFGFYEDETTWAKKRHENELTGLQEDVRLNGVQFPVGLGTLTDTEAVAGHNRVRPDAKITAPQTGKQMVTGGTHRIEAAYRVAPDQPIPVLHHKDILEHQGVIVPESHKEFATVRSQGGTAYRMPKMVGARGYETQKISQPWGPYR